MLGGFGQFFATGKDVFWMLLQRFWLGFSIILLELIVFAWPGLLQRPGVHLRR